MHGARLSNGLRCKGLMGVAGITNIKREDLCRISN